MKAIKVLLTMIALASTSTANAAIIATYDFTNAGTITGQTTGTINETGTAVLDDIGNGQAVMTINKEGVTTTFGSFIVRSRIVYEGTLNSGIFSVVSGRSIWLNCMFPDGTACGGQSAYDWKILTEYSNGTDSGGLPWTFTQTSSGISWDNLFHVADATETMLTREDTTGNRVTNRMTFTNTAVPVPAAAWLFGSGLLGLMGIARHRVATRTSGISL